MGHEVQLFLPEACQNTHSIPRHNIAASAERLPPNCGFAGSDMRAVNGSIGREHPPDLGRADVIVIVEISGRGCEVIVV
jgi:hypothetical protein